MGTPSRNTESRRRIGLVTTGMTGMVNASLKVATTLREAGFEVVYACPIDVEARTAPYVDEFVPLDSFVFYPHMIVPKHHRFFGRSKYMEKGRQLIGIEKYRQALDSMNIDLLIIDLELHECTLAAYELGIPSMALTAWFSHVENLKLPPLFTKIIPGRGMEGVASGYRTYLVGHQIPDFTRNNCLKYSRERLIAEVF